jgi:hypothetical protein
LAAGAHVHAVTTPADAEGVTALQLAAEVGNKRTMELLLENCTSHCGGPLRRSVHSCQQRIRVPLKLHPFEILRVRNTETHTLLKLGLSPRNEAEAHHRRPERRIIASSCHKSTHVVSESLVHYERDGTDAPDANHDARRRCRVGVRSARRAAAAAAERADAEAVRVLLPAAELTAAGRERLVADALERCVEAERRNMTQHVTSSLREETPASPVAHARCSTPSPAAVGITTAHAKVRRATTYTSGRVGGLPNFHSFAHHARTSYREWSKLAPTSARVAFQ